MFKKKSKNTNEEIKQQQEIPADTGEQTEEQSSDEVTPEQVQQVLEENDSLKAENEKLVAEIEKLNRTVERLQSSADNSDMFRDQLVALKADFDSYRRRMRADQELSRKKGVSDTLQKVFPVMDDLNRAKAHLEGDALVAMDMTIAQFTKLLGELGVEEMAVLGEPFDPNTMNALSTLNCGEEKKGLVVEVFKAGYRYEDKVLRYAEVIVGE